MSSPVKIPFESFIVLDRNSQRSIYLQIAQQLINAIQRGYLLVGTKLPGTRIVSELLGVHRKTVVAAFEELEAQGWLEIRPNIGTFIVNPSHSSNLQYTNEKFVSLADYPQQTGFVIERSTILDAPLEQHNCTYEMSDGLPDVRLTQIHALSQQYSASMKRKSVAKKVLHFKRGATFFTEQLTHFLNLSRGLHISASNVLVTRSMEMSLYILAQVMLKKNDLVLVGNLSYYSANMIFQQAGATVKTLPMDDEGLDVTAIKQRFKKGEIRAVYVTPQYHYPTTVNMSASRRLQLLELANELDFAIIEDDYDNDFHYDNSVTMPLASADTTGMVIYIGSFGKSLIPTFRTGFIVGPENLIIEARKYLGIIDPIGDPIMEHALGEMMEEGDINRHLKKSLKVYQERRDHFCQALKRSFGELINFQIPKGGLAVWIQFTVQFSLVQFINRCAVNQLFIPRICMYQSKGLAALRLGFGQLTSEELEQCVLILRKSFDEQVKLELDSI